MDILRNKRRKTRSKVNILNTEMQKRQQNTYGFLFIPGKHEMKRKVIYTTSKRFCQSCCNALCSLSKVAIFSISSADNLLF